MRYDYCWTQIETDWNVVMIIKVSHLLSIKAFARGHSFTNDNISLMQSRCGHRLRGGIKWYNGTTMHTFTCFGKSFHNNPDEMRFTRSFLTLAIMFYLVEPTLNIIFFPEKQIRFGVYSGQISRIYSTILNYSLHINTDYQILELAIYCTVDMTKISKCPNFG